MKRLETYKTYLHAKGSRRIRFSHAAEAGIILAIFLTAVFFILYVYGKIYTPVYLITNSTPVFQGTNGYGTVIYHPEEEAKKELSRQAEQLKKEGKDTADIDRLITSIACGFDQDNDLENGQTITYACTYDQAAAMKAGYSLHHLHRTFTVTDLKRIKKIDPFDYITIQINASGNPVLNFSEELSAIPIDYEYTFIDADNVTIRLLYDETDAARNGYKFIRDEKTIPFATSNILFDQNALSHLSKEEKEKVNQAASQFTVNDLFNNIVNVLPDQTTVIRYPSIERWYIDADGTLCIVYNVDTSNYGVLHTWSVTVSIPVQGKIDHDEWHLYPADQPIQIIGVKEGPYQLPAIK